MEYSANLKRYYLARRKEDPRLFFVAETVPGYLASTFRFYDHHEGIFDYFTFQELEEIVATPYIEMHKQLVGDDYFELNGKQTPRILIVPTTELTDEHRTFNYTET